MKLIEETRLIDEYKIYFKGRVPISRWPGRYADIFHLVQRIQNYTFDVYAAECQETPSSLLGQRLYKLKLSSRAQTLSTVAQYLVRKHANEQKWRLKVEQLVFDRFDQAKTCQKCCGKRWKSEVEAVSDDPDSAHRLQRKQAKRSLCTCSHADHTSIMEENLESHMFDDQASERLLYDVEDSKDRRLPTREPDRVIGLQRANVFDRLFSRLPHTFESSSFSTETPIFPFLIAEAKSEKGGPGWSAIERQSAFPIRTLIKIQASLMSHFHRGYSINPLVWFLAWEGDEWRVYAATWNEGACHIFDLLHFYIADRDDALRLLLLMDYIYDWARDVYRSNILRSLEHPPRQSGCSTPSDSRIQSNAGSDQLGHFMTEPESFIYDFVYENSRRYHAYRQGAYPLPNDEQEQDRLDFLHRIFKLLLNDKLIKAIIVPKPQRVLDIGTGTGIWAIDFADEYPLSQVIGSDLSPIQPLLVPPNCTFEIDDIESEWLFSPDEAFGLIHGRTLGGSIRDWAELYENAYMHLVPGGWIEMQEFDMEFQSNSGMLVTAASLKEWQNMISEASITFGKNVNMAAKQKEMMQDAGFVEVTEHIIEVPIGPWHEDPRLKEIGEHALVHVLDAIEPYCLALFASVFEHKWPETQAFLAGVRNDLKNLDLQLFHRFHFVSGQRPGLLAGRL